LDALKIRLEQAGDTEAVRSVVEAAFGRTGEADLVDQLRRMPGAFALVATRRDEVIGHLMFSPTQINGLGMNAAAVGLAPLAIRPTYQRQGVGKALMNAGLQEVGRRGIAVVVVLGHRDYYPRFGFMDAAAKGLTCRWPDAGASFMVLEVIPGMLGHQGGHVTYAPAFDAF